MSRKKSRKAALAGIGNIEQDTQVFKRTANYTGKTQKTKSGRQKHPVYF